MSTPFLPFITEKSSEESILKAIVQRTKGSGISAIANLFSVVIQMGISQARKKFEAYPDNLTTSAKVKELIADHTQFHIKKSDLAFWSAVMRFEKNNSETHKTLTNEELEAFFVVLATNKPERLLAAGFDVNADNYKEFSCVEYDTLAQHMSHVTFSEKDSERVGFTSWEEFKAYIAYKTGIDKSISILPVVINKTPKDITLADYESNHCSTPYSWE